MTEYHRLLKRQLKRASINLEEDQIPDNYLKLFEHISNAYTESEAGYYTTIRSSEIASEEMNELRVRLQQEQDMIRAVMSEGLCVFDSEWKIVSLNETGAKLLSSSIEELKDKNYSDIFTLYCGDSDEEDIIFLPSLENILLEKQLYHCERAFLKTHSGVTSPIAFSINPLTVKKNNQFNGAILLFRSTRERVDTEAALQSALKVAEKSNKAKTIFLANMSHEIRTPLNGIMGMLQLLLYTALNDKQQHYVKKGFECAESLLKILGDILDFAKIEAGRISFETLEFSLKHELDLLMAVFTLQCDEKDIELQVNYDNNIPIKLKGDIFKIKQIINNLINNAVKFTPQNGKIEVSVKLMELNEDNITLSFSISDTGIGIPLHAQDKIFEMFSQADESTTRKYGGTGLGLAITKQLVEMMGGQIHVSSEEGAGSTFHFTLKLNTYVLNRNKRTTLLDGTSQNSKNFSADVLVVEDNEINSAIAFDMLKMLGCIPVLADCGESALKLIQEKPFDIIFMDCHMPGMDGFKTTQKIRELERDAAKRNIIIALTANALKGTQERCLDAGMDDYMTKPISMALLTDKLIKYLPKDPPKK